MGILGYELAYFDFPGYFVRFTDKIGGMVQIRFGIQQFHPYVIINSWKKENCGKLGEKRF
jgi:hypothetical protein